MSTLVIKYGGHAMDNEELRAPFAKSIVKLVATGMRVVLVHGGGPHISSLLSRLNIESHFVDGLRVTDSASMEAVEMALCGQVNKAVVSLLQSAGGKAVGICGKDGGLFTAKVLRDELGLVGDTPKVNDAVVECLLAGGFTPVVAPVAANVDDMGGAGLNINADTAAGALAGALQADYFVLVSDVPGVLNEEKELLPRLDMASIASLKESGVIYGGMLPKVDSCLFALQAGCKRALILDGRQKSSLERYLLQDEALGTVICNDQ